MTTLAVGDIQGCYEEFRALLHLMDFSERDDQLWIVGDLVNRGPHNVETMDYVMSLPNVVTVLGNHDLHFVAVACRLHRAMPGDTLDDLLTSTNRDRYIDWLRCLPLIHTDLQLGYAMVHAGLPPMWTLDECIAHAGEVERVLSGAQYQDFLAEMYGNQPDIWHEDLTGNPRLRIITNYFTRMRYCNDSGRLELTHKTRDHPDGFMPWFTLPRPDSGMFKLVFGHWAALNGNTGMADVICLDTGCVWGRALTGIRFDDGRVFSVPSRNS